MRYAPRPEYLRLDNITGIAAHFDEPGPPTELDNIPSESPSEPTNTLHVPVAAVETVPIKPRAPRNTLKSGVVAIAETIPVVPTGSAAGALSTREGSSAPAEPET